MRTVPAGAGQVLLAGGGRDAALGVLGAGVEVTLADGSRVPYANLDYAASAPCARAAADAVAELLPYSSSVHRGAGAFSQLCTDKYENARKSVAEFLGCRDGDQVVFTRNTTDSLNLLARAVPAGTTVVTFAGEHHANLLPWRDVVRLPAPSTPAEAVRSADAALHRLLRSGAGPLLLAVTGASNVTGEVWPLAGLAAAAHRNGARLAVDAAQLVPHRAVSMAELDLDYLAFSAHKLYAPFGVGVLAGRGDWLDAAPAYLAGGGAAAHVGDTVDDIRWAVGPARHEGGSPNVAGVVALAAVCDALLAADRPAAQAAEEELLERLRSGLSELTAVRQLGSPGPWPARVGIVSFVVDGFRADEVSTRLAREFGIGVRDGMFCAHSVTRRLLRQAGASCTSAVRASIGLGTEAEHVDRLVHGIRSMLALRV